VEVEINTSLLYSSGSAELEDEAIPVLRDLAGILQRYPNQIQVEGFTDNLPINNYIFPSNWELSAARAAGVVHLFMRSGVQPDRMSAIGFGEFRPIADNISPEGRRKNRRVVLVIMSQKMDRRSIGGGRAASTGAPG
jgi:chemotaxis protein MotB